MPTCRIVLADKGYDSYAIRRQIEAAAAAPNIPPKVNRRWKLGGVVRQRIEPLKDRDFEHEDRVVGRAAAVRYHYDRHDQFRAHLANFVSAYNFGRGLKTLGGLTCYEAICKACSAEPKRLRSNLLQQISKLNIGLV